ncbi:MAG: CCA tRNA nucleotidyltransferase [Bacilli bacterium]|nr:CCA tRNA nucleotidyltransferase [Bacilli bacterium]
MNDYIEKGISVLKTLEENGYQAYFVGGFVRDYLLGIDSGDIDITTDATPDAVSNIFARVKETGKKYGTVTVLLDDFSYEVTTFRTDGVYLDSRHPQDIEYANTLLEDLKRRDFTINAIVMDKNQVIHDYFDCGADLKRKLIRTIGNPVERFNEDSLRILRAFRFMSKLGFALDLETKAAIEKERGKIATISIERVMVELDKIFRGDYWNMAVKSMIETGVAQQLYGLEKGLVYLQDKQIKLMPLEVFMICFILDDIHDIWRFSNKHKNLIIQVIELHEVTKEDIFNQFIVFVNGLEVCLMTNKINVILGYPDQEKHIRELDANLPIKDVCDLVFKGQDILWLTPLKKKSVIGVIIDDIKYNVIMGTLPNEYEALKEFAFQRIKELNIEMGEQNE